MSVLERFMSRYILRTVVLGHVHATLRCYDVPFSIHCHYYGVGSSCTTFHSSGKLSTRFRSVSVGISAHSSRKAFVRSDTDVGREGLAHSLRSNSSQRCWMGLRSGLGVFHTSRLTPVALWTLLCALQHSHAGTGKVLPQTAGESWKP